MNFRKNNVIAIMLGFSIAMMAEAQQVKWTTYSDSTAVKKDSGVVKQPTAKTDLDKDLEILKGMKSSSKTAEPEEKKSDDINAESKEATAIDPIAEIETKKIRDLIDDKHYKAVINKLMLAIHGRTFININSKLALKFIDEETMQIDVKSLKENQEPALILVAAKEKHKELLKAFMLYHETVESSQKIDALDLYIAYSWLINNKYLESASILEPYVDTVEAQKILLAKDKSRMENDIKKLQSKEPSTVLAGDIKALDNDIKDLDTKKLKDLSSNITKVIKDAPESVKNVNKKKDEIAAINNEADKKKKTKLINEANDLIKKHNTAVSDAQKDLETLNGKLAEYESKFKDLNVLKQKFDADINKLAKIKLDENKKLIDDCNTKSAKSQESIDKIKQEIDAIKAEKSSLEKVKDLVKLEKISN